MHDMDFVRGLLDAVKAAPDTAYGTKTRMVGMLTLVSEVRSQPLPQAASECAMLMLYAALRVV